MRVRKEAVYSLSSIVAIVSENYYQQRLLTFYIHTCQDKTWSVRKACVEILPRLSKISKPKVRENELTQRMLSFLTDRSRWVKIQAYKALGEFIITLMDQKVNNLLIQHYASMVTKKVASLATEKEIPIACA